MKKRPEMLYRYLLPLLFCINTSLAQEFSSYLGTTADSQGTDIFAFKESIHITSKKKGITIFGCMIDSAMVVIFEVRGANPCVKRGARIVASFTDGSKLDLENLYSDNCEQKLMVYFARALKNLEQLEMLKSKQILTLEIWTTPSELIKTEVPSTTSVRLSLSFRCLSNCFGIKPPSGTTTLTKSGDIGRLVASLDTTKKFVVVESPPEFEGGMSALMKFIIENQKMPKSAKRDKIHGIVHVTFVIGHDGSVSDAKIQQGVRDDVNAEALRLVNLMPKWKPGMQQGKPVSVRFNLPIMFRP